MRDPSGENTTADPPRGGGDGGTTSETTRVSVVVTGYRRPEQLRTTIESFLAVNTYENVELILADDGSPPETQEEMRKLPFDHFVFAERNRGLGANTNAGLAAASGDYVLQLQDDWVCSGPSDFLARGVEILRSRDDVGIVRYGAPRGAEFTWESCTTDGGLRYRVYPPRAGSEEWLYSDWPHLKSRAFIDFIGPYMESRYMQWTEREMRDRFNAQTRYAVAYIEGYEMFEHIGNEVSHRRPLPSARIGQTMDRLPLLRTLARVIRRVRNGRRS